MTPATAEVAAAKAQVPTRWAPRRVDLRALNIWVLAIALVLYLGLNGGGYSITSHGEVGIVAWWIVVVSAAWGLLPGIRPAGLSLATVGLFAGFTAWTALGITWSISSGRSFQDLALVTCYLGVLVLAVTIHRDRAFAIRHTTAAVASAIVLVAAFALASRLWPDLFAGSRQTGQFLGGAQSRLSWPLNYWNALATLMAIGVPLLLALATSARTLWMQALAAAAIPLAALCDALTLSRGGVIEAAAAVLLFLALAPDRIPKLATTLLAAAGSAVLVYGGLHRSALQHGLTGLTEHRQAMSLLLAIVLVCAGVALAQAGVGMVTRHASLPAVLTISRSRARLMLAVGAVVVIVVAIAAGAPHRLQHTWDNFKNPVNTVSGSSVSRLSSTSGEGRYQFWVAAVDSASGHVLTGSGPGTFQLDWLPRAPFPSYVQNAHSLYVETYAELGLVGLILLVGFLAGGLAAAMRAVVRSRYEERTRAAATVAAMVAFLLAAAFDWVWQMPVVTVAMLLLLGAALAPARAGDTAPGDAAGERATVGRRKMGAQVATVAVGLACLVATAYPLATSNAIASSQSAGSAGNIPQALADAQAAVRIEPGSAAAQLQLALAFESRHEYGPGVSAARHAVADEPQGWSNWLVLSRLEAENGNAKASLAAYLKARSLNPQSSLFHRL